MFGEPNIVGSEIVKLDKNKKMILPSFTHVENGDELSLVDFKKYFVLLNKKDSIFFINTLISFYKRSEDFEEKKKFKNLIRVFHANLHEGIMCDKNNRITLPIKLDTDELLCQGRRKHLELRPIKKED